MSLPVFHKSYIRVGPSSDIGANSDGEGYGPSSIWIYFSGVCRITDRNAVVQRDEECVRVSAKDISKLFVHKYEGKREAIISQFSENGRSLQAETQKQDGNQ